MVILDAYLDAVCDSLRMWASWIEVFLRSELRPVVLPKPKLDMVKWREFCEKDRRRGSAAGYWGKYPESVEGFIWF